MYVYWNVAQVLFQGHFLETGTKSGGILGLLSETVLNETLNQYQFNKSGAILRLFSLVNIMCFLENSTILRSLSGKQP
jgi:hypothetical protein